MVLTSKMLVMIPVMSSKRNSMRAARPILLYAHTLRGRRLIPYRHAKHARQQQRLPAQLVHQLDRYTYHHYLRRHTRMHTFVHAYT
jgi:hypothetical protein